MKFTPPHWLRARSSCIVHRSSFRRRGFSFAEVMFAVVVLGIGFIMIAAIFPVAIQQSKATADEAACAALARAAVTAVQETATDTNVTAKHASDMPALTPLPASPPAVATTIRGQVYSIRDPQGENSPSGVFPPLSTATAPPFSPPALVEQTWNTMRGNLIEPSDPRYGYVILYRRDIQYSPTPAPTYTASPFAQIYVIGTLSRKNSSYSQDPSAYDVASPSGVTLAATATYNLQARPVKVLVIDESVQNPDLGADIIVFDKAGTWKNGAGFNSNAAAEGAYVIIARDNINTPINDAGRMNGRVYRLGARRTDLDKTNQIVFELQPGSDFSPDPGADGKFGPPTNPSGVAADAKDDIVALDTTAYSPSTVKCSAPADAFIVGRSPVFDSSGTITGFEGPAQDVSLYTTFIQLR
jgi:hypothetical protein